jgi:signal transduction histidine kinase
VLLRAAQEALANVRKHAGARRVEVTLARTGAAPGSPAGAAPGSQAGGVVTGSAPGGVTGSPLGGVTGSPAGDAAVLTVDDDGGGFDPAAPTAGYGLAGMRRRVEEIGGTLSVHSGPNGTRVEVRC